MTHKLDKAAGGIVVQEKNGDVSIVLIQMKRPGPPRWSLPKGHYKKSESPQAAAVREVMEETGLEVDVLERLGAIDYWFSEKGVVYHKFVDYFSMRATGGSFERHDDEVTDVRWFTLSEALRVMAYENERAIVAANETKLRDLASRFASD